MFIISYLISLRKQPSNSKKWKASLPLILRSPRQGPDAQTQLWPLDDWGPLVLTHQNRPLDSAPLPFSLTFSALKKWSWIFTLLPRQKLCFRHFMLASSTGNKEHWGWAAAGHSWTSFCTGGSAPPASSTPSLEALCCSLGETKSPSSCYSQLILSLTYILSAAFSPSSNTRTT